ncbi:MAG: DMT family transporter [Desulfobacteraceae bacterium]|nr:DMT family transporter [Desulfobacteraceae bacterium]
MLANNKNPVLILLAGAFIISFSSVFVKLSNVPPTVSAFYRVFFGSLFLIAGSFMKKEFKNKGIQKNILGVVCGLLFALDLFAWHWSIQYIGPGLATILGNFQVFVLSIVGFLVFKERIRLVFVMAVPLAFFGLFLVIGMDISQLSPDYIKGIWLGLATAGFYSGFLLLLRKLQADKNDFSLFYYLMLASVSSCIILGARVFFSGQSFAIPDMTTFVSLLVLGVLNQGIAWVMISNALPLVRASHAGLILLLQPSLSFVWDVLFFDRPTGLTGWGGVIVVIAAIYMGMSGNNKEPQE